MASNTISFLGRRFFLGVHKEEDQNAIREQLLEFRDELIEEAKERFEYYRNQLQKDYKEPKVKQPPVNRRRRAEPVAPEPEQPVVNRRRRAEPEPTPVQTTNFLPSPYNVEMNADKVANIRVFAYVAARVVVDPLDENKLYDLDQYEESFGGYVFDPEHMYWWDYEQNDYIFKTNIEEARQWA